MSARAACRCGQLRIMASGEPVRISVCHCLDCQKRSGSAFAAQVRFPVEAVTITGQSRVYPFTGDSGDVTQFHFCDVCGTTLFYRHDNMPETIAIALGNFEDPYAFVPTISVWEERQHEWVEIAGGDIEHFD